MPLVKLTCKMNPTTTTDPSHVPFLRQAYQFAYTNSDDSDTYNGALLVNKEGKPVLVRANQIPYGIKLVPTRLLRPDKYTYIEHAERNVIYAAACEGILTKGATLVVPWYACISCSRAIIAARISKVIGHKAVFDRTPDRWRSEVDTGLKLLNEAGIETILYDGQVGECNSRIDGKDWTP